MAADLLRAIHSEIVAVILGAQGLASVIVASGA
jgi:hypothetical protein